MPFIKWTIAAFVVVSVIPAVVAGQRRGGPGPTVTASEPPDGAIDARLDVDPQSGDLLGWQNLMLTIDGDPGGLEPADFIVTQQGAEGLPPTVMQVLPGEMNTVELVLSAPIQPGAWTTISLGASAVQLGFLPGDVNEDGRVGPLDNLALVDALNGAAFLPMHAVDIDRSGVLNVLDLSALLELLKGWQGPGLPAIELPPSQPAGGPHLEVLLVPEVFGCPAPGTQTQYEVHLRRLAPGEDILIRGVQFDTAVTDAALTLDAPLTYPLQGIHFWDLSGQAACAANPLQCGTLQFIVDDLPLFSITYFGLNSNSSLQVVIPGDTTPLRVGLLDVTVPNVPGVHTLDVVNGLEDNVNIGFYLVFGFGVQKGDPVTTWRVNTGEVVGGVHTICVGSCTGNEQCADGDGCNGPEFCDLQAGVCVPGLPPPPCEDDGLFCNGPELCDPFLGCVSTGDPCEGTAEPLCDESGQGCVGCLQDSDCDDGLFCTGVESCDGQGHCVSAGDPCGGTALPLCDDGNDRCVECLDLLACDDGNDCNGQEYCDTIQGICQTEPPPDCTDQLFCNGSESCDPADGCQSSGNPCAGTAFPLCDETNQRCVECFGAGDCDDSNVCNGQETCNPGAGTCQSGAPADCDDGLFCTGQEDCHPAAGCGSSGNPCSGGVLPVCDEARQHCVECLMNSDCLSGELCITGTGSCSAAEAVPALTSAGTVVLILVLASAVSAAGRKSRI